MEQSVNGIRNTFYRDLSDDYESNSEESFLYRFFRENSVAELAEKYLKEPAQPKDVKARLSKAMRADPEWAKDLLLQAPPGKKERRDFWEMLLLNDAGYQAGLISDTAYYLWLAEYLEARGIYYKDNSMYDGHVWLYRLLQAGLWGTQWAPGSLRSGEGELIFSKAQAEQHLKQLAELIRSERDAGAAKAAGRLHGLTVRVKGEKKDYLPWLTARLERMAIHVKVRTWLQDNGYPIRNKKKQPPESAQKEPEQPPESAQKPPNRRKRDFTMRLFETYCDSPRGYDFRKKEPGGGAAGPGRLPDSDGFCVPDPKQAELLRSALERSGATYCYIPLAFHLRSGCTFFLAGKDVYGDVYEDADEKSRKACEDAEGSFCFDYLRLDGAAPQAIGGAFRLRPTFHENVGRSCHDVLDDFKRYCENRDDGPLQAVREFNEECPPGVPDAFRWAFDGMEERKPSPEAEAAFRRARNQPRKN